VRLSPDPVLLSLARGGVQNDGDVFARADGVRNVARHL
jgi:hypothetical protein